MVLRGQRRQLESRPCAGNCGDRSDRASQFPSADRCARRNCLPRRGSNAHRKRTVARLAILGRGVLATDIRRMFYKTSRAAAVTMADDPRQTLAFAWAKCRGRHYPPTEQRGVRGDVTAIELLRAGLVGEQGQSIE